VRPDVPVSPGGIVAGKYRIDAVNGFGGMGIVCEGFHLDLQTKVEVQIARREHVNDERAVARILSEIRSAAQLRSQHTRRVLDCGRLDVGALYMVVEHLDGENLRRIGTALGRLPVEEAMSFVLQACEALGEAHSRGIVHGDLTPENLFLTNGPDGGAVIKVLELGVSKQLGHSPYMSPEQRINPTAVDARADIWSLGVLLHEFLTGKVPRSLSDVNVGIPDSLAAIVLRCMDKKRDARFPDAAALGRALRAFGGLTAVTAERVEEILRRARVPRPERETSHSVADMPASVAEMPASVVDVPASVVDAPDSVAEQRDSVVDMPDSVVDVPDSVPPSPVRSIPSPPPLPMPASKSDPAALQTEPTAAESIPEAARSVSATSQSVPAKRPSLGTKPPPLPPSQSPSPPMLSQLVEKLRPIVERLRPIVEKPSARLALAGVLLGAALFALFASPRSRPASEPSSASAPSMQARVVEPAPRAVESAPTTIDLDEPVPLPSAVPVASPAQPPPAPATAQEPASDPARTKEKPASSTKPATAPASSARKRAWSPFPELKQPVLPPHVR
jgi:eukaryotic-like serine/threonine-protein kinase